MGRSYEPGGSSPLSLSTTAVNQVVDASRVLVTAGTGVPTSGLVLTA